MGYDKIRLKIIVEITLDAASAKIQKINIYRDVTMKKAIAIGSAIILIFAICAALYHTRKIDVLGHEVRANVTEISFSGDEIKDVESLSVGLEKLIFLKKADLGTFHMFPSEGEILSERFPHVVFEYVPYTTVAGMTYPLDAREINLEGKSEYDTSLLESELSAFYNLEAVTFGKDSMTESKIEELRTKFPSISFSAVILRPLAGHEFREDAVEIDLSGATLSESLCDELEKFPSLETLTLFDTGIENVGLFELKKAFPNLKVLANAELGGALFSTDTEEIQLNFTDVGDFDVFFDAVSLFGNLSRVEVCDSGLTNEQMEKLCDAYPDTKFVWRVHLGQWSVRTDAIAFSVLIRDYSHKRMTSEDIQVLKYCKELQALDLGHQAISDISVIGEYLTGLRVLILADNRITDLSPLSKLEHLHYLEFFVNQVTDLTPLASCRELVDLNISYNYRLSDITPLLKLPLLERLWLEHVSVSASDVELLRQTYPDARIVSVGTGSIDQGWRSHERYFAMIDMYYNDYMSESFSKYDGK